MDKNENIEKLKFPIGKFEKTLVITNDYIKSCIAEIESFPKNLNKVIDGLSIDELSWKYRPGGWTIFQVVHHCADSHMNSFIRFKLTLTEDVPTIRPYFENKWAELPDAKNIDVRTSLKIIEGLHARWVILLKSLTDVDFNKEFYHPESNRKISIAENVEIYAWHCRHHLAHIKQAINSKGKFN